MTSAMGRKPRYQSRKLQQHPMEEVLAIPELRTVLRFSLKATYGTTVGQVANAFHASTEEPDLEKSPAFRKLVEQILFSRRFVPTYFLVIFLVIAIFSTINWFNKYIKWRSRSKRTVVGQVVQESASSTASSSSSTLQSGLTPTSDDELHKHANETVRLLPDEVQRLSKTEEGFVYRLVYRARSLLMYQPAPFPALTSPANNMPPHGTTLLIGILLGINIFYLFYHTPLSIPMLFALADRAGLCFVVNLPVLYFLAAKTNYPTKALTGWSYEGLNIFHRRLGEWMTVLATVHSVSMIGVWYTLLRPLNFTLVNFLSSRIILLGIFAFASYLALYVTSTGYFRQLYYETFLGLHIILQVAALILLYFHHHNSRPYVLSCLAIWVFDRIVARFLVSTKSFVATLQIAEDGQTVLLFCEIPIRRFMSALELDMTNGWQPGQHVFVTIPGMGWKHRLQAHPFSIASPAPPADQLAGKWPLELIIRAKEGFSKELLEYAKFHQHTQLLLDGPHGSTEALTALRHANRKCLIAGGSGIAVTYPLAWDMNVMKQSQDMLVSTRTVYENGQKQVPDVQIQSTASDAGFAHFWIKSSAFHQKWITSVPRLDLSSSELAAERAYTGSEVLQVGRALVTESYSTQEENSFVDAISRRPDVRWMLTSWVQDFSNQKKALEERICVVVSGPDGMVRDVRNASAALAKEGWKIELFVEKFGW